MSTDIHQIRRFPNELLRQPRGDLALRLTLLLLLLRGFSTGDLQNVLLSLLCGLMLISNALFTSRIAWFGIFVTLAITLTSRWQTIDNHKYLIAYWCLACMLTVNLADRDEVLGWNARILIGLVFLFSTIWKLLAGEYLDGSFLHATFLLDRRFEFPAKVLAGLSQDLMRENRQMMLGSLMVSPETGTKFVLNTNQGMRFWTLVGSYWILAIEGSIGLAFLLPRPRVWARLRNPLLMVFILTTYIVVPVPYFATLLAIMGFAQCPSGRDRPRLLYLALAVGMQLTQLMPNAPG